MDKVELTLLLIPDLSEGDWRRFKANTRKFEDCLLWISNLDKDGYGRFSIKRIEYLAHRVSYNHFNGSPSNSRILHSCNNRACVNPEHLRVGNQSENIQQSFDDDRSHKGELHPKSKLTEKDVIRIRFLAALGMRQIDIVKECSCVSSNAISKIIKRKTWKHI